MGSDNVDTWASVEYLLPRVKRRDTVEHGTKSSIWVCTRLLNLPPRDAHPVLVADSECFKCVEIRNPLSAVMDGDYRVHKEHLMVYDTSHTVVEWKHVGCEGQVQCGPLEVVLTPGRPTLPGIFVTEFSATSSHGFFKRRVDTNSEFMLDTTMTC